MSIKTNLQCYYTCDIAINAIKKWWWWWTELTNDSILILFSTMYFEKRRFSRDSSRLKRDSDSSRKLQRPQSRRLHGFIVQM